MWYGKESVYKQKFDDAMGLFFTEEEFPELATEKEDVSRILQAAIDRLIAEQCYGILYIPEGEYPLKSTVLIPPSVRLIGYGQKRPLFILPPNTEGYSGLEATDKHPAAKMFMSGYPGANYMFWFIGNRDTKAKEPMDANAGTFYSAISNIDFRIDEGNPYAVCIRAHFAQHGFISHCHFELGDGLSALFDVGNEMEDLTIEGGQYGIICRMCSPGWPFALLDSVFHGQKYAAIITGTTGFTGFRLHISDTPKAFDLYLPKAWEKLYLEDCIFENISGPAINFYQTSSIVQQTNIRNVHCKNVPVFVHKGENDRFVNGCGEIYTVNDYSYGYMYSDETAGTDASIQEICDFKAVNELPDMPSGDIPAIPPMEKWVSLAGYGAKGDGETDDTAAIQKAVSTEDILYFPQGIYKVTDTITLKKGITIIGMSPITTQIVIEDDTPAFEGFGTPKAVVETAQGGHVYMNGIGIDTGGKNPRAVGVKWMADATSYMNDVKFVGGHGLMFRDGRNAYAYLYNAGKTADYDPDRIWDFQYSSLFITSGGGGVFKDIWSASPYAEAGIAITDTETPGKMYAISLEHHVRNEIKLYRVKNWKFYALQTEEERAEGLKCLPMELVSCENITFANFFLFRVVAVDRTYDMGIRTWDCRNIEFMNLHNKAQMHYVFTLTLKDENSGFYAKSPEYARFLLSGCRTEDVPPRFDKGYEIIAEGFDFAQGAVIDDNGDLYWCDKSQKRIYKYDAGRNYVIPFYDIHFAPAALALDTAGNLLVATDYSALRKTIPGQPYLSHDTSNFHPFFAWFYKRGDKAYAVSLKDPFNTMTELVKTPADLCNPEVVYRPSHLSYYGMLKEIVEKPIEEYYMAPDGVTALEGTIDLARSLMLSPAVSGQSFYMTDDSSRKIFGFEVTDGGNLLSGKCFGTMGQYGVYQDEQGVLWTVDDKLYGYKDGANISKRDLPWDAYTITGRGGHVYVMGRGRVYKV